MRLQVCLLFGALFTGCSNGETPCEAAAGSFVSCVGQVPAGFAEKCASDDRVAQEVNAASCDELRTGTQSSAKADGVFGWKNQNERCSYNWQCEGNLVCRAVRYLGSDQVCLAKGKAIGYFRNMFTHGFCGDLCESDADCEAGLLCFDAGLRRGMCLTPEQSAEPAERTACGWNP